jgi:hypothetical protein
VRFAAGAGFSPFSGLSAAILYPFRTEKTATLKWLRLPNAPGADVLPVFSPDYKQIMWTSTRDGRQSSQLYIADFIPPKDE